MQLSREAVEFISPARQRIGRVGPDALVWAAGRQPGWFLLAAQHHRKSASHHAFSALIASFAIAIAWRESRKRSFGPLGRRGVCPYARNVFQDLSRISANIAESIFPPLITAT